MKISSGCRNALLGAAIIAVLAAGAPVSAARTRGGIAPYFRGVDLKGRPVNLGELIAQKRVVVFFWDYRRATSTREMNVLDRLYREHAKQGLEILGVEGEGVSRDQVVERVEKLQIIGTAPGFPLVPDPGGRIARQFRVETTPQTFLVDRAGRIVFFLEDFRSEDEALLEEKLRDLLGIVPPRAAPVAPPVVAPPTERAAQPEPEPPRSPAENPQKVLFERYRYFGNYHANRKEMGKAEEYYRKCLEIAPDDPVIWLALGETYAAQGSYERAREAWETVLRLDPGNAEADANIRRLIRGEY